jgi:hypothetical protein
MLNIFLSYARADLAPVLAIEQGCARLAFLFGGIKISSTVAKGGQRPWERPSPPGITSSCVGRKAHVDWG